MTKIVNILLLITFLAFFAYAQDLNRPNLYQEAVMPAGEFRGQALDTSIIRPFVLLSDGQILRSMERGYFYVANFYHNEKNYIAKIPREGPRSVSFIYEKFINMPGGHADLVYEFKKKIVLEHEIIDKAGSEYKTKRLDRPIEISEVLFTAEAVKAKNTSPPLFEGGMRSSFAIANRLTSVPARLKGPVIQEGRDTSFFEVPFEKSQVRRSFEELLRTYSRQGLNQNYHLIHRNCITSALLALEKGMNQEERLRFQREWNSLKQELSPLLFSKQTNEQTTQRLDFFKTRLSNLLHGQSVNILPISEAQFFTKHLNYEERLKLQANICRNVFN